MLGFTNRRMLCDKPLLMLTSLAGLSVSRFRHNHKPWAHCPLNWTFMIITSVSVCLAPSSPAQLVCHQPTCTPYVAVLLVISSHSEKEQQFNQSIVTQPVSHCFLFVEWHKYIRYIQIIM